MVKEQTSLYVLFRHASWVWRQQAEPSEKPELSADTNQPFSVIQMRKTQPPALISKLIFSKQWLIVLFR